VELQRKEEGEAAGGEECWSSCELARGSNSKCVGIVLYIPNSKFVILISCCDWIGVMSSMIGRRVRNAFLNFN
jgi:hypothetical protein